MTAAAAEDDGEPPVWYVTDAEEHHPGEATLLGFWIYLMSDALIFATLFATYGVLSTSLASGPGPREIFELSLVAVNTSILLLSSLTFGAAMLAMQDGKLGSTRVWLVVTALLGAAFVGVELDEFGHLIGEGAGPQRSAVMSAFVTHLAPHGLPGTFGIIWIGVMLIQLGQHGLDADNRRSLQCLSLFWHFLDIVWIGVFTFVYLFGSIR